MNVAKILLAQQAAIDAGVNMDEEPPVSIQLQDMLASNCNNEIIIESTVVVPKNDDELKESIKKAKKQAEQLAKQESNNAGRNNNAPQEPAPVNKAATEYIIENIIHTNVNVLKMK